MLNMKRIATLSSKRSVALIALVVASLAHPSFAISKPFARLDDPACRQASRSYDHVIAAFDGDGRLDKAEYSGLEPATIRIGDGLGNFARIQNRADRHRLRSRRSGKAQADGLAASNDQEEGGLAPDILFSELSNDSSFETDNIELASVAGSDPDHDSGLHLSYPRKRGPPEFFSAN